MVATTLSIHIPNQYQMSLFAKFDASYPLIMDGRNYMYMYSDLKALLSPRSWAKEMIDY